MKRGMLCAALFCGLMLLAACASRIEETQEDQFLLYYPAAVLDSVAGEDAIVPRAVTIPDADTMTTAELAQELVEELLGTAPDTAVQQPMPAGTSLLSLNVRGSWAHVDFSRQYARLAGIDLTIADYCVTLTLTQLDGVNAVSITAVGRELPYRRPQALTAADPLLSTKEDALRTLTVSLYFFDEQNGGLRAEKQALALYEGQTRVNAVLEALLRGPENSDLSALLPEDFHALSSRVEDGICYLNLPADTDFGASAELAVQSLVASICSLDYIHEVQIVVEGEIVPTLCGVDVSAPLYP